MYMKDSALLKSNWILLCGLLRILLWYTTFIIEIVHHKVSLVTTKDPQIVQQSFSVAGEDFERILQIQGAIK